MSFSKSRTFNGSSNVPLSGLSVLLLLFFVAFSNCDYLPGVELTAVGYDAIYVDYNMLPAVRSQIKHFSYHQNKTAIVDGIKYIYPDQCQYLNYPVVENESTVNIYVNSRDVIQDIYQKTSYNHNWFMFGTSSKSKTYRYHNEQHEFFSSYTAVTDLTVGVWKLYCNFTQNGYTDEFMQMTKGLPREFNRETCPAFKRYFAIYGTHGADTFTMGGRIYQSTSMTIAYYNSVTTTQITYDIKMQYMLVTKNSKLTDTEQEILNTLDTNYESNVILIGGQSSTYNASQITSWMTTVASNPVPLQINMTAHYYLTGNQALKNATMAYLQSYMTNWNYLGMTPPNIFYWPNYYAAGVTDNKVYIVGAATFTEYDPYNNSWLDRQPYLNGYYSDVAVTGSNGYIYAAGGIDLLTSQKYPTPYAARYDTTNNIWQPIAEYPDGNSFPPYAMKFVTDISGVVYSYGGYMHSKPPTQPISYKFDTSTMSWIKYTIMATARRDMTAEIVDDVMYIMGGMTVDGSNVVLSLVEALDLATGIWYKLESIPVPLASAMSYAHDGIIYLVGGYTNFGSKTNASGTTYIFDTHTRHWKSESSPMVAFKNPVGGVVAYDFVYCFGDLTGDAVNNGAEGYVKMANRFC